MTETNNKKAELILVVDDDEFIRDLLKRHLTNIGYEVRAAASAGEAIALTKSDPFVLALIDILMPEMTGLQLISQLKIIRPEMLLVTMTGHPSLETALEAMKKGVHDYLVKPFRLEQLDQTIASCLEKHRILGENNMLKDEVATLKQQLEHYETMIQESALLVPQTKKEPGLELARGDAVYRNQSLKKRDLLNQDRLEKLQMLKQEGMITEEEFQVRRKKFLPSTNEHSNELTISEE